MEYKFNDGKTVEIKEIIIPKSMEDMFKVNLPSNLLDYLEGNGEGVWACGDVETLKAYNNDVDEGIYFVKILNDSIYYPLLKSETFIPVEMRGENRPTAIFEELQQYGESKKNDVLKFVIKRQRDLNKENNEFPIPVITIVEIFNQILEQSSRSKEISESLRLTEESFNQLDKKEQQIIYNQIRTYLSHNF